ncbi:hypothetical protein [Micromonospora deserti]|uniref:Serine/threonine protein kinase n=1 Tax=Micromonospora deserti TaxID=2070366 RepID=A0A2W2D3J8_9ACTN|nr:hypothetical protein [Micromonospora deserti]PZF94747.1 hypothetical protein C1I99_19060 [Micromonospora deserti]
MKRWTPMLTLLTGSGMAAVLFTMSAQAAPPAAQPDPGAAATASASAAPPAAPAAPAGEAPAADVPEPSATRPAATSPPAAPPGPGDAGTPERRVDGNWTGRLDNGATIAISVEAGAAVAYVCDGTRLEIWLRGTATDGDLALTGKEGARLTGTVEAGRAAGELVVGERRWRFTATATAERAPVLYRATARVRDAGVDGGWIMRPDGTQIGVVTWNGEPVAAPPLDPAFGTTIVRGVRITAEPVIPGPVAGG